MNSLTLKTRSNFEFSVHTGAQPEIDSWQQNDWCHRVMSSAARNEDAHFYLRWAFLIPLSATPIWQNQQSDCASSKDSDHPGHPPSLIRVFAARMKKAWVFSYPLSAKRRLWSDWADAQADLSLRWAHTHFVGFVMSRIMSSRHQLPYAFTLTPIYKFSYLLQWSSRNTPKYEY